MAKKLARMELTFPANLETELFRLFQQSPLAFFKIPQIRDDLTVRRIKSIPVDEMEVAQHIDSAAIEEVLEYNLDMIRNIDSYLHTLHRPMLLINALNSIYYIQKNRSVMKVLCVGPRTEAEFFMLLSDGFKPENLTGLDLISYSDFVDAGDMHDMPYDDDSFDIVFLGWVLTYSTDLQRVAEECVRVAKPGGYIAIGVESTNIQEAKADDTIDIKSTDDLLELFDGHIHAVPFRHDVHRTLKDTIDMQMVVIELN